MKALMLILFSSSVASAQTAWFPIGKNGANTNYSDKETCESKEGQTCHDIGPCPLDECTLVDDVLIRDGMKVDAKKAKEKAEREDREAKKARKSALREKVKGGDKLTKEELEEAVNLWLLGE